MWAFPTAQPLTDKLTASSCQKPKSTEVGLESLRQTLNWSVVTWKKCQNNSGQVIYLQTVGCHKLEFLVVSSIFSFKTMIGCKKIVRDYPIPFTSGCYSTSINNSDQVIYFKIQIEIIFLL